MKNTLLITLILLLFACPLLYGQYQIGLIPNVSPDRGIYKKIGYTEVDIKYGSPAVKNREVWGHMAAYDQVWRAGANYATTIEFSEAVQIEGQALPKGKYALFIIPRAADKWTIIFSTKSKQWGAFRYDSATDALRVDVLPQTGPHQEQLEYQIDHLGFEYGIVTMAWERIRLPFEVKTDYVKVLAQLIDERVSQADESLKWVIYLQGAEYLAQQNKDIPLALQWINTSENLAAEVSEWNKQFYPKAYVLGHVYWTKAKLLALNNDLAGALKYAQQLKEIQGDYTFYKKKQEAEGIDELEQTWIKEKAEAGKK